MYLYKEEETIPTDNEGKMMFPLLQVCLDGLPYIPDALKGTKVLTVFISKDIPASLSPNGDGWIIREYTEKDLLVIKDLSSPSSPIKPFPLKSCLIEKDYPVWDSGDIPTEIEDELAEMEDQEEITDYCDYTECYSGHKIGGYPCYIQSGVNFGDGFEFVLQIASDEKANFNVIDNGNIYLAKNRLTGEWVFYCDFY